jgi:hypothetical protein
VRGRDRLESPVRVVPRHLLERAGDGTDREPGVADRGGEPPAGTREFPPGGLGLGPEPFQLVLHEVVEDDDPPLQGVQVVERGPQPADHRVPLGEERERRLVH